MVPVRIGTLKLGRAKPFFIAGPCVIESEKHRTSSLSFRGPGLDAGLRILEKARSASGLPKTILENEVASAALARMEELRITSLVVVDPARAVIGVLHIDDLRRTQMF